MSQRLSYGWSREVEGAPNSWTGPEGPSTDPRDEGPAGPTEDHPIEYAACEGVVPEERS